MITEAKSKNWYIVHTYSGFEERVRQNLRQRIEAMGMQEKIGDIRIPTETLVEMKGGFCALAKAVITAKRAKPPPCG